MEKYGETSNRGGHPVKEEWAFWKKNPGLPVSLVILTALLLCVIFLM